MFKLELTENIYKTSLEVLKGDINSNSIGYYNPIYKQIYSVKSSNCDSVCFNTKTYIKNIVSKITVNRFTFKDQFGNEKSTFMKFCPLVDPIKYLAGNYNKTDIFKLPKYNNVFNGKLTRENKNERHIEEKINNYNNSAYVDGFFSYLSSKLLNNHNFIHGLDFYGSFTCIKNNYNINITDDLEHLMEYEYFIKNLNNNYKLLNGVVLEMSDTRKNKDKIKISNKSIDLLTDNITSHPQLFVDDKPNNDSKKIDDEIIEVTLNDTCPVDAPEVNDEEVKDDYKNVNIKILNNSDTSDIESSEDSDSESDNSISNDDDECDEEDDECDEEDDECDEEDDECDEEDEICCDIEKFPTNVVALEDLENTLDHYIENSDNIKNGEWASIFFQIVITLCVYQEKFNFYHNDLHTSNVMYIKTSKQFLYYCFKGKYYKVPTYGKIYKIIDFGRSIYSLKDNLLFSDSFSKSGDAHSQYNCDPYFNDKKKVIMPNKSFDLVRLGCSLFDYFFDDIEQSQEKLDEIESIINFWCLDDNNKNILYNNNNVDRYPEFKLYKMIARTVHNKVPEEQLSNKIFDTFRVSNKIKNNDLMNIDDIPKYS